MLCLAWTKPWKSGTVLTLLLPRKDLLGSDCNRTLAHPVFSFSAFLYGRV